MPNIAAALKQEIARLARKELKSSTGSLKKAGATCRSEIAALKRRLDALDRQLKKIGKKTAQARPAKESDESGEHRWRAAGFAQHRKRLGLSAADCGKLIGVSALTIYKWEGGQAKPRAKYMPVIASVRRMGKREAATHLASAEL